MNRTAEGASGCTATVEVTGDEEDGGGGFGGGPGGFSGGPPAKVKPRGGATRDGGSDGGGGFGRERQWSAGRCGGSPVELATPATSCESCGGISGLVV